MEEAHAASAACVPGGLPALFQALLQAFDGLARQGREVAAPFMHTLFDSRSLSFTDGLVIMGVAVAFFLVLELEKLLRRLIWGSEW